MNAPNVENGIVDLSSWDFKTDGPLDLKGSWKFWWQEGFGPEKVKLFASHQSHLKVPSVWNHFIDPNSQQPVGSHGFGLYMVKIIGFVGKNQAILVNDRF